MPKDGFKQSVDSAVDRVKELKWTPWSKRSGTSGTCKSITKGAREFLEAVSGGDMVEFMKGLLKKDEKAELFMSLCGSLPQCINSLPLEYRRQCICALIPTESGTASEDNKGGERWWTRPHLKKAGFTIGDEFWKQRFEPHDKGGRPKKLDEEMIDDVKEDLNKNSQLASQVLVRETAKRKAEDPGCEEVKRRNLEIPKAKVWADFVNKYSPENPDGISRASFYRAIPTEYRQAVKRTDLCEHCLEGQSSREWLRQEKLVDWNVGITGEEMKHRMLMKSRIPAAKRKEIMNKVEIICEVDMHKSFSSRQKQVYNKLTANPGDDQVVVDCDFKQKGRLPMREEEGAQLFYGKKCFTLLGFGVYYRDSGKTVAIHCDMVMETCNQDSFVVSRCFDALVKQQWFPKRRRLSFWSDGGKHLRNKHTIHHVLTCSQFSEVDMNYFVEYHGKSQRDGHFGVVSRSLEAAIHKEPLETVDDVIKVLKLIKDTKPLKIVLNDETVTIRKIVLPFVTGTRCLRRRGDLYEVPFMSDKDDGVELKLKTATSTYSFRGKRLFDATEDVGTDSDDDDDGSQVHALKKKRDLQEKLHNHLMAPIEKAKAKELKAKKIQLEKEKKKREKEKKRKEAAQKKAEKTKGSK
eukprot:TRINITY_DN1604_c0_g1_i5.p1 TRINITY_DN1604_c0_g1~~TRINITY_DN1604_c0_g1_i5.p1  ORF type:complete len:634 (-),score=98.25 TRINITY_DN1604_c0_g1_i5:600-2501(-)